MSILSTGHGAVTAAEAMAARSRGGDQGAAFALTQCAVCADAPVPRGTASPVIVSTPRPEAGSVTTNWEPATWSGVIYRSTVYAGGDAAEAQRPDGAARGGDVESRRPSALLRAVRPVRGELVLLLGPLVSQLRTRRRRIVPATAVLLLLMLLFASLPTGGMIGAVMRSVSAVSADLPWWQAALRLPGSMFAPAPNLPSWGAFVQVAVVAGAAESSIGWRRMLLVGIVANAAATAGARVMAWLGPHSPLGISSEIARQPDTGPSVFVTAVLIYLAVVHRTPIVRRLTALIMIAEVAINPNLAGREHLIGMATATVLACAARARYRDPGRIAQPALVGRSAAPRRPLHPSRGPRASDMAGRGHKPPHHLAAVLSGRSLGHVNRHNIWFWLKFGEDGG